MMVVCPVEAGQDLGEGTEVYLEPPNGDVTSPKNFICYLKVDKDGHFELQILASFTDEKMAPEEIEPNILTRAMAEIVYVENDGQPTEMVQPFQPMTQPENVKAGELMNVGDPCFVADIGNSNAQPVATATYAGQDPPRSEISDTHFVDNDGLTEAREIEIKLKSMAMATQATVDPEQEPPKEQLAPNQVPCGTEVSKVERPNVDATQMQDPHDLRSLSLVSRRWSADTDDGFYSAGSVLSEANTGSPSHTESETRLRADSPVKCYRVDDSRMDFNLTEDFNPTDLINQQLCAHNQSASSDWQSDIDLDQYSKELNELWDIEMSSVLIPRGQNQR